MRRARASPLALVALALVLGAAFLPGASATLASDRALPVPIVQADLNVTAVLAGINLTTGEKASLLSKVNTTWWPVITSLGFPLGVNNNVRVHLVDASDNFTRSFADTLVSSFANDTLGRVVGNYVGLAENLTPFFPAYQDATPVRHADADEAAAWLANAHADFPEVGPVGGGARLFFLNPYTVGEPYYYAAASAEHDRKLNFTYETVNAWGDGEGVFFQDLRAAPSHLGETGAAGRPANFAGQPPIWSYGASPAERARLVADLAYYIDASVKILVAPSFVVTPFYPASYTLEVSLFDATASQDLFRPGGAGAGHGINATADILDANLVGASLRELIPFAPVSVRVTPANRTSDPATWSALSSHMATLADGSRVIDPFAVAEALRTRWAVPALPVAPDEAVSLPALLVVRDGTTWVDAENVRGVTLQRSDGRAAGIIIAAGLSQLEQRGFSETLVHEGGHSLGLGHPHEVGLLDLNGTGEFAVDWLRSSSSTPMTYLPSYVDYTFDSFDRHALWYGIAAAVLAGAFEVRLQAFARLDALGYTDATLPANFVEAEARFAAFANETRTLLARGLLYIEPSPPYSSGGAIVMAKRAFDEAEGLLLAAFSAPRCCGEPPRRFLPDAGAPAAFAALSAAAAAAGVAGGERARRRP